MNQQNSQFSNNKQERLEAVTRIALAERESVCDNIDSLIRNNDRFSLENLMNYTPQYWLNKCNQVVVRFIKTLTWNNNDSSDVN